MDAQFHCHILAKSAFKRYRVAGRVQFLFLYSFGRGFWVLGPLQQFCLCVCFVVSSDMVWMNFERERYFLLYRMTEISRAGLKYIDVGCADNFVASYVNIFFLNQRQMTEYWM